MGHTGVQPLSETGGMPSPLSVSKPKQGTKVSVSNTRGVAFYRCSEINGP